jgi:aerobic-type carbon monoxide dehydrogenase small subunit (CoxS/CutS family)
MRVKTNDVSSSIIPRAEHAGSRARMLVAFAPRRTNRKGRAMDQKKDPEGERGGHAMSRRSFLHGSGLGAAGTIMLDKALPDFLGSSARAAETDVAGPGPVPITLHVNNVAHELTVAPNTTLAAALRESLELSGTKVACDRGACSACTVWLDGMPVAACMMLAIDVGGRKITTIEGLAQGEELHPVQSAFIAHDAMQCGFCTPGLVMSCAALVETNPAPTLEEVKAATSGHLCRCGAYPHVYAAMLDVARNRKS